MSLFERLKNTKKKVDATQTGKVKQESSEEFKMNMKGQRVFNRAESVNIQTPPEDIFRKKDTGPQMLSTKLRLKVWLALMSFGVYFYLTYRLIKFRLKSDDLELMEREVKEEFKLKTKLNEFKDIK